MYYDVLMYIVMLYHLYVPHHCSTDNLQFYLNLQL